MENKIIGITSPALVDDSGMSSFVNGLMGSSKSNIIHVVIGQGSNTGPALIRLVNQIFKFICLLPRVQVMHINVCFDYSSLVRDLFLVILSKIFGRKVVVHMHGGKYISTARSVYFINILFKMHLHLADRLILLSENEVRILKLEGLEKVNVIQNSVKFLKIKSNFWKPSSCLKIIYLGRLDIRKGLVEAIDAIAALERKGATVCFDIYGDGPDKEFLEKKIEELNVNSIYLKGSVGGERKLSVIENADVFLMPSYFEGLPFALLETMAFGVLPVVTNVGSINSVVIDGQSGLFVDVKSHIDIVKKVEYILANPDLMPNMCSNAYEVISCGFRNDDACKKFDLLYKDLIR